MAMNANDQKRLGKELKPNLYEAATRLLTLQTKISAALDDNNLDSLRKAMRKADDGKKAHDKHTIDQHRYALKQFQSPIKSLSDVMQPMVLGKVDLAKKYDSLVAIGKAHPMLFKSGDFVFQREPEFVKSLLSPDGQLFYKMRGSYPNASMFTIAQRLPELCNYYAKIRALLIAPSMT